MDYIPGQYQLNTMCNLHFWISNIRYFGGSWVNEEVLVRVCDDGGDRYRFGFNGQEKVNEISGMGNHNTAEFWEYDTRLGRRWNVDPVDQISISNYAVFRNSPLVYTDVDGDCVDCDENYPDAEIGDIVSPEASRLDWQKADNGEWLALGGEFNEVNIVASEILELEFSNWAAKADWYINEFMSDNWIGRISGPEYTWRGEDGFKNKGWPTMKATVGVLSLTFSITHFGVNLTASNINNLNLYFQGLQLGVEGYSTTNQIYQISTNNDLPYHREADFLQLFNNSYETIINKNPLGIIGLGILSIENFKKDEE